MTGDLLGLAVVTVLVIALVRTLMPRASHESEPALRLRRAQWLTVAFAVPTGYLALLCVVAANFGGVPDRRGMIAYALLGIVVGLAVPVLRAAWKAVNAARRQANDDARRAAGLHVVDGADDLPPRHHGLNEHDPPSRRW